MEKYYVSFTLKNDSYICTTFSLSCGLDPDVLRLRNAMSKNLTKNYSKQKLNFLRVNI